MSTFDEQIKRMKSLYTYGRMDENNNHSNYSIEYHATGADGKEYGIIRECKKFYIKSCPKSKAMVAEAYGYIGGEANKSDYVYESYDSARKNFDLKMKSLNEAYSKKPVTENLDPFKVKGVEQGTEKMMNEIARMRQIMANTAALMNESSTIGATPFSNQPEAAKGHSGDVDTPFTEDGAKFTEQDDIKTGGKPEDKGTPFGDGGKTPEGEQISVEGSVASMSPKGGKVVRVNESEEDELEDVEDVDLDAEDADVEGDEEFAEEPAEEPVEDFEDDEEPVEGEDLEGDEDLEDEDEFDFDDFDFDDFDFDFDEDEDEVEDDVEDEPVDDEEDEFEIETDDDFDEEPVEDDMEDEVEDEDFEDDDMELSESRARELRPLIKMIAESIINEDELHVWGQHPGYRKKPMKLPVTGVDHNEHGEDINDESVHSEAPFGSSIGDGMPFNKPVSAAMKNSIAEAIAARILGKKKVN